MIPTRDYLSEMVVALLTVLVTLPENSDVQTLFVIVRRRRELKSRCKILSLQIFEPAARCFYRQALYRLN